MNDSLNDCVKAWLCGILDDIKKAGWVNGRMGNDNLNIWMEKWTFKILRYCTEGYKNINLHVFRV